VAGHWGKHQTQELISRNFTWNCWAESVANYVAGCVKCQKSKADRHSRQTKLMPMPTGERPFEEIAIGFVGELPKSGGFNAIIVLTGRFTKVQHYIPAKTTWTAANVADAYINDIWRLYGLPRHITSDCGPNLPQSSFKSLIESSISTYTSQPPTTLKPTNSAGGPSRRSNSTSASTVTIGKIAGELGYP